MNPDNMEDFILKEFADDMKLAAKCIIVCRRADSGSDLEVCGNIIAGVLGDIDRLLEVWKKFKAGDFSDTDLIARLALKEQYKTNPDEPVAHISGQLEYAIKVIQNMNRIVGMLLAKQKADEGGITIIVDSDGNASIVENDDKKKDSGGKPEFSESEELEKLHRDFLENLRKHDRNN